MKVSVCIPYGKSDDRRAEIFTWVLIRWLKLHPDFEILLGNSSRDPWSRSEARNDAVSQATGDVLIIADADTFTTPSNVERAFGLLDRGVPWVIGSGNYYSLDELTSDFFLDLDPGTTIDHYRDMHGELGYHWKMYNKSIAGMLFVRREDFERSGGYDERFLDWGWEDNAFQVQMDRTVGKHVRTAGELYHLHHEPGLKFDQPYIDFNERLFKEIRDHGTSKKGRSS